MSKKIVMIGNGNYAETLKYYINDITDWEIVGYADEIVEGKNNHFDEKPFVNLSYLPNVFPASENEIVIGVGYHNMNTNRKRIYEKIKSLGYTMPNIIHPTSILNNAEIGDANIILENCVFEPRAKMGSNIIMWSCVLIGHDTYIADHNHFAAVSMIAGNVKVGEGCFLGNHSTVKDGTTLAEYTLVGAGAYVSKNTEPYDVIVPARSVKLEKYKSTDLV